MQNEPAAAHVLHGPHLHMAGGPCGVLICHPASQISYAIIHNVAFIITHDVPVVTRNSLASHRERGVFDTEQFQKFTTICPVVTKTAVLL